MAEGKWKPAFDGQRPPFQPGHELSTRHGAYSPRKVDPLATALVDALLADDAATYLRAPAFRPAVWSWARAEAQTQLLTEYLGDTIGDLGDEKVRAAYLLLHRAETRAQTGRARLGLDPLSRARLGKDVASGQLAQADLATMLAEHAKAEREGRTDGDH